LTRGTTGPRVSYEEAVRRLLARLSYESPTPANRCGDIIWPENRMRSQGAAFAAGKILHRAQRDGLVRWTVNEHDSTGWVKVYGAKPPAAGGK
jgi:hypothetical protein